MTRLGRQLVVWALAVLGLLAGAGTALAHNVITASDPADGANLSAGPAKVSLTFDLPVRQSFSTITVLGPDQLHYAGGPSTVTGSTVSAPVNPLGPAGRYTIGYRIVSDDGHPVTGSIGFTLTQPGTGRGTPAAASGGPGGSGEASAAAAAEAGEDGGIPAWPWVLGGVLLVAAGATAALRLGRNTD